MMESDDDWETAAERLVLPCHQEEEEEEEGKTSVEQRARHKALKEKGRAIKKAECQREAEKRESVEQAKLAEEETAKNEEQDLQRRRWHGTTRKYPTGCVPDARPKTNIPKRAEMFQVQRETKVASHATAQS